MALLGTQAETWQCLEGVKHKLRGGSASRGWRKPQAQARKLSKRKVRMRKKSPLESIWPSFQASNTPASERCEASKTDDQRRLIKEAIMSNPILGPIFADVRPDSMLSLADFARQASFSLGETILKQGDSSTSLWIVAAGEVEILVEGRRENVISSGMCFGELNYLNVPQRAVSVVALTEATLWELRRDCIVTMRAEPLRAKLAGHAAMLCQTAFFQNRSPRFVQRVADLLSEQTFKTGEYIFRQHDEADAAYFLVDGSLIVEIDGVEVSRLRANPARDLTSSIGSGALTELRIPRRRAMSARVASVKADILVLDRQLFLRVLRSTEDSAAQGMTARRRWNRLRAFARAVVRKRYEVHRVVLDHADHFNLLPADVRNKLAHGLRKLVFLRDEYVFREGDQADMCYVMLRGMVSVIIDGIEMSRMEADMDMSKTPVFGMQSLMGEGQRKAAIRVISHKLEVLAITRETYQEAASASLLRSPSQSLLGLKNSDCLLIEYRPEDLVELGLLGKGGFGSVTLVKHKPTGYFFALKAVSKGYVMAQSMQDCIINERNILRMVSSPFVIQAVAFFNSPQRLLLLTELALGGELYDVCERNKLFGKKEECRFFLACVVAALEHLHSRQIVYRGLKSESILLDTSGYTKLKDFGFAKVVLGRTTTVCGTPHYFAPELVMGIPYGNAVDWWALGVLLFELNTGRTPFETDEPQRMFAKIACGIDAVVFPPRAEIWPDLVASLCAKQPSERLPMCSGGVQNIRSHQYYAKTRNEEEDFDWTSLYQRSMKPPFTPDERSCEETRNFPQDVVTDPQTMDCSSWRDQWAQFEDRWGPAIWEDPEDDPRSSLSPSASLTTRMLEKAQRTRRSIFPPPPRLKEPEFEFTSSTVDDEMSKGTDDEDPGLSRGMPKTSPRVQMPVSLGDVDEPDESVIEPEPEEDVIDTDDEDEKFTDHRQHIDDGEKISPMEMFSRRQSSVGTDKKNEWQEASGDDKKLVSSDHSVEEKLVYEPVDEKQDDSVGEKLVYEPPQTEAHPWSQRLGVPPTRVTRDDEVYRKAQLPFITSGFADLKKGMSLKLAGASVEVAPDPSLVFAPKPELKLAGASVEVAPDPSLVFTPKPELAPAGAGVLQSPGCIYKPPGPELVEDTLLSQTTLFEYSDVQFEEDPLLQKSLEEAPSPTSPGSERKDEEKQVERKTSNSAYDFKPLTDVMSSRLHVAGSRHASVPYLGSVISEGGNAHVFDLEQIISRDQAASLRNPFITPTGSINERYCQTVPQSPALRTRTSTSGVTASPMPTYRDVKQPNVNSGASQSPSLTGLERNSPMMSSRVIKFQGASTASCPSSPQYQTRTLKPPEPGSPAGYNTARPPRPTGGMVPSPTLKNRIIAPDTSESLLSNRIKPVPLVPNGTEPKSPYMKHRNISSEKCSLFGNRGLREPPSAARSMQATTFSHTSVKPATLMHMSATSTGGSSFQTQPHTQPSTMRILRGPRQSNPSQNPHQSMPANTPQQQSGVELPSSNAQRLRSSGQQTGGLLASSQQQPGTPLLRPRSPLRSPALSHRNISSTPLQFPRSPGTPQSLISRNLRIPPSKSGDMTAAAIMTGLGHTTPRSNGML